jgi:NitT/TauT family transport system substrate-binding protein
LATDARGGKRMRGEERMTSVKQTYLGLLAAFCFALSASAACAQTQKITLSLEWLVSGRHVGFFVAKDKGFYRDEGLDVTIERGYGSNDTATRVATGTADFGIVSVATVIQAIANNNAPIELVSTFFNDGPEAVLTLKSSGIKSPQDLSGKRIAGGSTSSSLQLLPALAKQTGMKDFQVIKMAADQIYPALLTKNADAIVGFTDNVTILGPTAKRKGDSVVVLPYSQYGVDNYGSGIVTSVKRVEAKDPVIKRFLAASLKGIAWATQHPDESVAILKKYVPTVDNTIEVAAWKIDEKLMVTKETREHGLGYMSRDRMASTYDLVKTYLGLKNPVSIDRVFTTEFLPIVRAPGS